MNNNLRVIKSKEDIQARINELAGQIRAVAPPSGLTVVGILDDAFVFFADLIRALELPMSCCFMKVDRHRHGGQSEVMYTSEFDPQGLDILLVGGVCATGVTLDYITKQLATRGIKSLRTCMLVDKPGERRVDLKVDFAAFHDVQGYVFGYGMGVQNQFRHLPYLAAMEE